MNSVKNVLVLVIGMVLMFTANVFAAGEVFDNTELVDLSNRIKEAVESAKTQIEPKKKQNRTLFSELERVKEELKKVKGDNAKNRLEAERERLGSILWKNSVDSIVIMHNKMSEINGSMIKLSDLIMDKKFQQQEAFDLFNLQVSEQMFQMNTIASDMALYAKQLADDDTSIEAYNAIDEVLGSMKSQVLATRKMNSEFISLREKVDTQILFGLEYQQRLRGLLAQYLGKGIKRMFVVRTRMFESALRQFNVSSLLGPDDKNQFVSLPDLDRGISILDSFDDEASSNKGRGKKPRKRSPGSNIDRVLEQGGIMKMEVK